MGNLNFSEENTVFWGNLNVFPCTRWIVVREMEREEHLQFETEGVALLGFSLVAWGHGNHPV